MALILVSNESPPCEYSSAAVWEGRRTSFCWGRCAACPCLSSRRAVEAGRRPLCTPAEQYPPPELWSWTSSGQRWEDGEPPGLQRGRGTVGVQFTSEKASQAGRAWVNKCVQIIEKLQEGVLWWHSLPNTLSLMENLPSPARFRATHSYTPAWCTVTISMRNECIPFSHTNILWKSSGRMAFPSRYQHTSGVGRPPTWRGHMTAALSPWRLQRYSECIHAP